MTPASPETQYGMFIAQCIPKRFLSGEKQFYLQVSLEAARSQTAMNLSLFENCFEMDRRSASVASAENHGPGKILF